MIAVRHEWGLLSSEIVWDGGLPPSTKIYPVGYTCQGCNEYFYGSYFRRKEKTAQSCAAHPGPGGLHRTRTRPGGRMYRRVAQHLGLQGRHGRTDGRGDRGTHPLPRFGSEYPTDRRPGSGSRRPDSRPESVSEIAHGQPERPATESQTSETRQELRIATFRAA